MVHLVHLNSQSRHRAPTDCAPVFGRRWWYNRLARREGGLLLRPRQRLLLGSGAYIKESIQWKCQGWAWLDASSHMLYL